MAMTLDGRTAPAAGGQLWISSDASRADVQTWRARSSAVLTGSGTVLSDDPRLDVRLDYGAWVRQPLRVVLDTELVCPPQAKIFRDGHALAFAAVDARGGGAAAGGAQPGGAPPGEATPRVDIRIERVPRAPGGLDLDTVMARLAAMEINEVLLECGARLAGAFVTKGLVDEMVLYVAPSLMGELAAPLLYLGADVSRAAASQSAAPKSAAAEGAAPTLPAFEFSDARRVGDDVRLVLTARKH